MKKQKQGFTLIELMVVIVIIGILAAIAIPKLFGMSAKAKASEVGPAAGTWSKLQSAFLIETGSFGSDPRIAYLKPGTSTATTGISTTANFTYSTTISGVTGPVCSEAGQCGTTANFTATNLVALGDCKGSGNWLATIITNGTSPTATVTSAENGNPCLSLTPNFTKLQ
jgi:prepilin-type N-terminal cleavage/methylation domain-containing protein